MVRLLRSWLYHQLAGEELALLVVKRLLVEVKLAVWVLENAFLLLFNLMQPEKGADNVDLIDGPAESGSTPSDKPSAVTMHRRFNCDFSRYRLVVAYLISDLAWVVLSPLARFKTASLYRLPFAIKGSFVSSRGPLHDYIKNLGMLLPLHLRH